MKKKKIAALAAIICLSSISILSGCSDSGKGGAESGSEIPTGQSETIGEDRPAGQGEAEESREKVQAGSEAEVVKGFQIVDGYGICEPGSPAFYQLSHGEGAGDGVRLELDNGMAKLRLLGAVRQGQSMTVQYEIADYSVKLLPEEETKKIREQEKENREKQEQGKPAEWDWSYICLDEEKGIYGRSDFETKLFENKKPGLYTANAIIYGDGMPAGGMTFKTGSTQTEYEKYFEDGALTRSCTKSVEDGRFTTEKPNGLYELEIEGFDEPLIFAFEKAPEYQTLGEIDGMIEQDGFYVFAWGKEVEGELNVIVNTYSEDGFCLRPGRAGVRIVTDSGKDGKEDAETLTAVWGHFPSVKESYQGLKAGSHTKYTCKLPKGVKLRSAEFVPEEMIAASDEVSPAIKVEIPEKSKEIEQEVKFRDAVVSLTAVHKTEDKQEMGTDENGETVIKSVLRIDASANSTNPALEFYVVGGFEGEEAERDIYYYGGVIPLVREESGSGLEGFTIAYGEGGSEVTFHLSSPYYKLVKKLEIPVLLQ